jgi:hypothetical protein
VFRRNLSAPSSGLKRKPSKKQAEAGLLIHPLDGDDTSMFLENTELSLNCVMLVAGKTQLVHSRKVMCLESSYNQI